MYKVVISGETKLWILHYCNHASTSGYCTFSSCPISQQKGKSKRARLMLSCTMSGLVVEQYSLLILLLIETKQKTEKEGCTVRFFFEAAGNYLQMDCQIIGMQWTCK